MRLCLNPWWLETPRGENWKLMPSDTNRMGPPLPLDLSLEGPEGEKMGTSSTGETLEPKIRIST